MSTTHNEMHQVVSRHYACEGRCYVLAAGSLMRAAAFPPELEPHPNRIAQADQWLLHGGSPIIGPDGAYVVPPVYEEPRILLAKLDFRRIREESMTLDVTGHYHRPELFEFRKRRRSRQRNG